MNEKHSKPNWGLLAGLRFGLAVVVLAAHLAVFWTDPFIHFIESFDALAAVFAFMMISGFSIRHSIERDPERFYWRRFRRIYPIYLGCLAMAMLTTCIREGVKILQDHDFLMSSFSSVFFLQTIVAPPRPNFMPSWSLVAEVIFYALAPFLLKLSRLATWCIFIASSALFALNPWNQGHGSGLIYVAMIAWSWALGWLMAGKNGWAEWLAALLLPIAVVRMNGEAVGALGIVTLVATALCILTSHRIQLQKTTSKILAYLGDISYPLYLAHWPVITVFWHTGYRDPALPILVLCVLCPAIVFLDKQLRLEPLRRKSRAAYIESPNSLIKP